MNRRNHIIALAAFILGLVAVAADPGMAGPQSNSDVPKEAQDTYYRLYGVRWRNAPLHHRVQFMESYNRGAIPKAGRPANKSAAGYAVPNEAVIKYYQMYGRAWGEASLEEQVRFIEFYNKWKEEAAVRDSQFAERQAQNQAERERLMQEEETFKEAVRQLDDDAKMKAAQREEKRQRQQEAVQNSRARLEQMMQSLAESHQQ